MIRTRWLAVVLSAAFLLGVLGGSVPPSNAALGDVGVFSQVVIGQLFPTGRPTTPGIFLPAGSLSYLGSISDVNGNAWLSQTATASAVDALMLTNAATGGTVALAATGNDANIPLSVSAKGTGSLLLGTGSNTVTVGVGGSALTNGIVVYAQSLTPTATSAAIQTATQTFTVTGLSTADKVYVNGPTPTSLCPMVGARVSAANTLALDFAVLTAAACTPASGTYSIVAIR